MKILVLNAGSSTFKSSLFQLDQFHTSDTIDPLWTGLLDYGKNPHGMILKVSVGSGQKTERELDNRNVPGGLKALVETLWHGPTKVIENEKEIVAVGHRVVHGGEKLKQPVIITQEVKDIIKSLFPIAPLHNPANLQGIELLEKFFPKAAQVAVFDTAYHAQMPEEAAVYPIPYGWPEKGIRRYGFHGISHAYCARRTAELLKRPLEELKILTCHLGNGSSLAATSGGHSIDTTMGFTPMEGLMMGTRCGSIDPGILLYFLREKAYLPAELDHLLNFNSGLKGICDSSDMRDVMEKKSQGDKKAELAFQMFLHSLCKNMGSLLPVLGSLDALVFTGGIGENSKEIRERACLKLAYAGIKMDPNKNMNSSDDIEISRQDSTAKVFVIHTREDWSIAESCFELLKRRQS
jgi:acetate kinase